MKFSRGEMVFHRLEIRYMAEMLQKSREKLLEEVSRHPRSSAEGQSDLGTFMVPSPDRDSEAGRGKAIILNFELKRV